jgi:glycine/serine hydroxymethyltransferase
MMESEMDLIAEFIDRVVSNPTDTKTIADVREAVKSLTAKFPLYA